VLQIKFPLINGHSYLSRECCGHITDLSVARMRVKLEHSHSPLPHRTHWPLCVGSAGNDGSLPDLGLACPVYTASHRDCDNERNIICHHHHFSKRRSTAYYNNIALFPITECICKALRLSLACTRHWLSTTAASITRQSHHTYSTGV